MSTSRHRILGTIDGHGLVHLVSSIPLLVELRDELILCQSIIHVIAVVALIGQVLCYLIIYDL